MATFRTPDGITLYYEDTGKGKPVLCLAGLTRNCRDFDFLAPHLKGYRMLALDSRGRGMSQYDPQFANYNTLHEAQDVIALLNHLRLPKVSVIGTSRGGLLAMTLAVTHRNRLHSVVLNDVGPVIDIEGIKRIAAYVGQPPKARTLDDAAEGLHSLMSPGFPDVPLTRWRQVADAIYAEHDGGLTLRYDPHLRNALLEQMKSDHVSDLWPLFDAMEDMPVGVIRGENSDILTSATLADMVARNEDLVTATVPDRGHAPFLDEPEALDVIRTILENS